jgi:hypothetical protein
MPALGIVKGFKVTKDARFSLFPSVIGCVGFFGFEGSEETFGYSEESSTGGSIPLS